MATHIPIFFNIGCHNYKLLVKTVDNRRCITLLDFKKIVLQKFKYLFKRKFDDYIWLIREPKTSEFLVARNDDLLCEGAKVRVLRADHDGKMVDVDAKSEDLNNIVDSLAVMELSLSEASSPQLKAYLNGDHDNSDTQSVKSNFSQMSSRVDHKRLLIGVIRRYNDEIRWLFENSRAAEIEKIWTTVCYDMNDFCKRKFMEKSFTIQECKEDFMMLLNLYTRILKFSSVKAVQDWQFFNIFHNELYLKPFDEKIDVLKQEFENRQ